MTTIDAVEFVVDTRDRAVVAASGCVPCLSARARRDLFPELAILLVAGVCIHAGIVHFFAGWSKAQYSPD